MPIATDVLQTVFAVKGIGSLLSAFQASGAAQMRLAAIEQKVNSGQHGANSLNQMHLKLMNANTASINAAGEAEMAFAGVVGGMALAAIQGMVSGLRDAVLAYAALGQEIQNVQDLTGASARESAGAVEQFQAAGMKSAQAYQEILRLAKDLQGQQGLMGLSQLGVSPMAGENGIHLMNRILAKLREMGPSLRRTAIEEELFGARGTAALAPLLRMTQAQADASAALGDAFSDTSLAGIQQFQTSVNILGQTVMARLVIPFVQQLMPALQWAVTSLTDLVNVTSRLNTAMGGLPLSALAFATLESAITGVASIASVLVSELEMIERLTDRLGNNFSVLATVFGGGLMGAGDFIRTGAPGDSSSQSDAASALNANTEALLRSTSALDRFNDSFLQSSRGGIPRGFQRGDIAELSRQHALGIIG